jgi:enoyl-CoA hydratase/carnithine racemase
VVVAMRRFNESEFARLLAACPLHYATHHSSDALPATNVAFVADTVAAYVTPATIQVIDLRQLLRGGAAPIRLADLRIEQVCG